MVRDVRLPLMRTFSPPKPSVLPLRETTLCFLRNCGRGGGEMGVDEGGMVSDLRRVEGGSVGVVFDALGRLLGFERAVVATGVGSERDFFDEGAFDRSVFGLERR